MEQLNSEDFFYLPERDQSFTNDKCFLCGIDLNDDNTLQDINDGEFH